MGVVLAVAAMLAAILFSPIGQKVVDEVQAAICRIGGGSCEAGDVVAKPERCLESSTTRSANGSILIAVVKVDKDSTLIRENYSDGTSRFVILDNSKLAGELYAGVKGKIDKYGIDYSASADAGLALAGAKVFELPNQDAADAFEEGIKASGGFDGLVRDLASYDDKIPFVGIDNPLGGVNDFLLDKLGVDSNEDLPEPDETYAEAQAFLSGSGDAGAGLGAISEDAAALISAAGVVKVVTGGENKGDVELSIQLDAELSAKLGAEMIGVGAGGEGTGSFTATVKLDAQNDYQPDSLELKGSAGYSGTLDLGPDFSAEDLAGLKGKLEKLTLQNSSGKGKGLEVGAELDLDDPANRAAALNVLLRGADPTAIAGLINRFNSDGELSLDTYDQSSTSTDSEVKAGIGIGFGAGGGSSTESTSGRSGVVRPPGGSFAPRQCLQPPSG